MLIVGLFPPFSIPPQIACPLEPATIPALYELVIFNDSVLEFAYPTIPPLSELFPLIYALL